ncbi:MULTISPECIES: Rieske 2Fe-2S domain-containing protein [unclassified Streptomyces]|uniref:cytochrome bc1 complex Rieske iron-sulfur subunit n=1 Tax=unclassified Streptomyces TaxID=2593676 RepID=UPI002DD9EB08|nr:MULTISPECIES: Rieske 2Fe-2S domain-containing protein [unclassified Streptomyces]WSA95256.1 Rieske (2Fe-2S) protein [Streptomyces sp. NBC_01795]WSB79674.1 Rieske (2Fe-2S) protein [Streptomyces sp. NBC_01775]WSS12123.1 Rieske (2Fe-2S) protein [Streptomyces sp. NBC_01186]WSS40834.1 Rieske (2Fe-2S) protein [Streptomyces sp. NBC_01187]
MSSQTGPHENVSDENLPSAQEEAHGAVAVKDDPFADPGLPPHEHRIQDIDERAAKRSERAVAFLFTLSMLATVAFIASFVAFPIDKIVYVWPLGHISALNLALGLTLGVALFCIGAGAVHWARTLMSDEEMVDERHAVAAEPEVREKVLADFKQGAKESAFGRRKLIRNTMFGAMALVPLSGVVLLRDLGPLPEDKLRHTLWKKGKLLVNENTNEPLRPEDIAVGSLAFAKPEGLEVHDEEFQEEIAKAALMIVRLEPKDIKDKRELDWSHEGIVAFSKICTHVGCPVSLYEQQTHHVLCPCHQSTFDLSDGARVLFGPAGHRLPQLKISVNKDGFLEAQGDFAEPVGPAFWERG